MNMEIMRSRWFMRFLCLVEACSRFQSEKNYGQSGESREAFVVVVKIIVKFYKFNEIDFSIAYLNWHLADAQYFKQLHKFMSREHDKRIRKSLFESSNATPKSHLTMPENSVA